MAKATNLDEVRRSALDSVEASRRVWNRALTFFACVEGGCWLAYLLLAYFEFSLPVLIAVAALLVYSTVFTGIMGLKMHLDDATRRVLQAIETLAENGEAAGGE